MFASLDRSKQEDSHNSSNPESFFCQRSVKRKYDNNATSETNGNSRQRPALNDLESQCESDFTHLSNVQEAISVAHSGSFLVEKGADYNLTVVWQPPQKKDGNSYTYECNSSMRTHSKRGRQSLASDELESQYRNDFGLLSHIQEGTSESFYVENEPTTTWQCPQKKNAIDTYCRNLYTDESEHCTQASLTKQDSCLANANEDVIALKTALNALYAELEEERNASAEAAKEAMIMIARLQEEKAAIQMEARQYKRMAEEREAHDQETIILLKELLVKRDNDVFVLENELWGYRHLLQNVESERWKGLTIKQEFSVKGTKEAGSLPNDAITDSVYSPDCLSSGNEAKHEAYRKFDQGFREDSGYLTSDSLSCKLVKKFDNVECDPSPRCSGVQSGIGQDVNVPFKYENPFSGDVSETNFRKRFKKPSKRVKGELPEDEHDPSSSWQNSELDIGVVKVVADVNLPKQRQLDTKIIEPMFAAEESVSPVWEHIKRLEERLERLGKQQECQKKQLHEWPIRDVVQHVGSDGIPSVCQKHIMEKHGKHMHPSLDVVTQSGCVSVNQKDQICATQITTEMPAHRSGGEIAEVYFQKDTILRDASLDCRSEESYNRSDSSEGILDIYEVESGLQSSGQHLTLQQNVKKKVNSRDRLGKPDTSPATLIEFEAGCSHEKTVRDIADCCCTDEVQAPVDGNDDCKNMIVDKEVHQMTCRLQHLEANRPYMKQAVESLRQENSELKLLQEIVYQVRELQGTIKKSQVMELSESERCSFHSFLKGIFPLSSLLRILHPWYSKFAFLFHRRTHSGLQRGERAGLPLLLYESFYSRTATCLQRRLKVKFRSEKILPSRMNSTKRKPPIS